MNCSARQCFALLLCLMTGASSGCYIRRGFAIRWDWAFQAHRTGCRTIGECPTAAAASVPAPAGVTQGPPEAAVNDCASCGPPRRARRMRPIAPAEPEPAASTYFHPIPMRPVFGLRSEQPDGIEAESKPLPPDQLAPRPLTPNLLLPIPQAESGEEAPSGDLPPPSKAEEDDGGDNDDLPQTGESAAGRRTAGRGQLRFPTSTTATVTGWRIAQFRRGRDPGVEGQERTEVLESRESRISDR